jgi:hypothetical protein
MADLPYELSVGDWQDFFDSLFVDCNTDFDTPPNLAPPACLQKHPYIEVGMLNSDYPPADPKQ